MPFYAVAAGKTPGIYNTWPECESQVKGFKYAKYRKFNTINEAKEFCQMNGKGGGNTIKSQGSFTVDQSRLIGFHQAVKRKLPSDESSGPAPSKKASLSRFQWVPFGTRGDYSDTVIVYTGTILCKIMIRNDKYLLADGACTGNGTKRAKAGM